MRGATVLVLGVGALAGGAALVYSIREAKARQRERSDRSSMPMLLASACAASERGDQAGFLTAVQAAGTLLDASATPQDVQPEDLLGRYQTALVAPDAFRLCTGDEHTLLSIAAELASRGYDYEAIQVLRVAMAEATAA